jgi:hypothetical protein
MILFSKRRMLFSLKITFCFDVYTLSHFAMQIVQRLRASIAFSFAACASSPSGYARVPRSAM